MRKFLREFFLILLAAVALASCEMPGEQKGHIVVSNQSSGSAVITEIYLKSECSAGFAKVFDGEILKDRNHCLEVNPAPYSVRITVFYPLSAAEGSGLGFTSQFETGYNIYRNVEAGEYIYVDFDGKGIYFR